MCCFVQVQDDLAMSRVQAKLSDLSVSGKVYTALAWLGYATSAAPTPSARSAAQNAVDLLMSDIRVGGRTAYISSSPGGQYPAGEFRQTTLHM